MADDLRPEVVAIHQWIKDDAPVSMKMTITPKLIAALVDRLDAARAQGPSTSGADEREEIARLTSRIDEERAKAASYPLGDPMCSRHGGIRDGLKEALEIILDADRAQGPGPADAVANPVDLFLAEVRAELVRARAKFPGDRIMTIALAEEFGELCKAILDEPAANVRKEAVQTAVMAARVVLDGDGSVAEWRTLKGLDPLAAFCVSHPGQRAVTNLDGDNLCRDCANAWVKAEGDHQAYLEQEGGL